MMQEQDDKARTAKMREDLAYLSRFFKWDADEKREIWREGTENGIAIPEAADWWNRMAFAFRHGYRPWLNGTLAAFEHNYLTPFLEGSVSKAVMDVIKRHAEESDRERGVVTGA